VTDQPINLTQLRERAKAPYYDGMVTIDPEDLLALIDTAEAAQAFQAQAIASPTGYNRPDPELAATENALWQALTHFTTDQPT